MAALRLLGCLFVLAPVTAAGGCVAASKVPSSTVRVVDAETKQPIAGASVRLWCPDPRGPALGPDAYGTTTGEGTVQVRSAAPPDVAVIVAVTAPGYLPEETDFRTRTTEAAVPDGTSETVVEVFTGPRPTVELIVPTGYRGLLKIETPAQDDGPVQAGVRSFRFNVANDGTVRVAGSPVLRQGPGPSFTTRYADGTVLPPTPEGLQIGLRWLRCIGTTRYYVVGTQADWKDAVRELERTAPPSPGAGKSSGKHRHERMGGR